MQHMVKKAHTRWVAANLISGHLAHAGNHRHGTAGLARAGATLRKQWSGQVRWPSARERLSLGATGPVLQCKAGQL